MTSAASEDRLLQRFWNEAGAYGSRIVLIASGEAGSAAAERYATRFRTWESDSVVALRVDSRAQAQQEAALQQVQGATGILLVAGSALRLAGLLGGTALAQTIRRMNAQSKIVCAAGAGASILCQHMLAGDPITEAGSSEPGRPFVHRSLVQFAPGLGIVNRVVLDGGEDRGAAQAALGRLLTSVAHNPFLIGVGLEADTGVVIYPNSTMEVFGENNVLVVDGAAMQHNDLPEALPARAFSLLGVQLHVLALGCTFNFDSHAAAAPAPSDLTLSSEVQKSAF